MKGTRTGRAIAVLLAAVLLCTMIPTAALAQEADGLCPHHTAHTPSCGYAAETAESAGAPCAFVCAECEAEQDAVLCAHGAAQDCAVCAVQALIDALPAADALTAEDAGVAAEALAAVDAAEQALTEEQRAQLDRSRYAALSEAAAALRAEAEIMPAADVVTYDLRVMGMPVTSENAADVLGAADDGATVSYNADTDTLTLQDAALRVSESSADAFAIYASGDLNVELIGNNEITSQESISPLNGQGDMKIYGSGQLSVTGNRGTISVDGVLTVDGATVVCRTEEEYYGGIESKSGVVIQNQARVESYTTGTGGIQCFNGLNGKDPYIRISDSTVIVEDYGDGWGIGAASDITVVNSMLSVVSDGAAIDSIEGDILISGGTTKVSGVNGIWTENGRISIQENAVVTAEGKYPAIYGSTGVTISNSEVDAAATEDVAIFAPEDVKIENSVITAIGADGMRGILARGGASVSGAWLETSGGDTFDALADSVWIEDSEGLVYGTASLPGNVEVSEGVNLTIPEGTELIVTEGTALTNYGKIWVEGTFTNRGELYCYSHTGGKSTCTEPAHCDVCGAGYGELEAHKLEEVKEKIAACEEDGHTAYWTCTVCGKLFADENAAKEIVLADTVVEKLGHAYKAEVTAPTCTEKGFTTHTCTRCGDAYRDAETAALGHTETVKNARPATCTAEGYTGDTVCAVCGTLLKSGAVIPLTAHQYEDGCCTVCGAAEQQPTPKPEVTPAPSAAPDPEATPAPSATPAPEATPAPGVTPTPAPTEKPAVDGPQTGDTTPYAAWLGISALSAAALGIVLYGRKKHSR